jgi:hypothetical protein
MRGMRNPAAAADGHVKGLTLSLDAQKKEGTDRAGPSPRRLEASLDQAQLSGGLAALSHVQV